MNRNEQQVALEQILKKLRIYADSLPDMANFIGRGQTAKQLSEDALRDFLLQANRHLSELDPHWGKSKNAEQIQSLDPQIISAIEEKKQAAKKRIRILLPEEVPPEVSKKYLTRNAGSFFFKDERKDQQRLAFVDQGAKLNTSVNDLEVAEAMMSMAKTKGWGSVKLNGSPEFKSNAFAAAKMAGLEVEGYTPTDLDYIKLEEQQKLRASQANSIATGSQVAEPSITTPKSSPDLSNEIAVGERELGIAVPSPSPTAAVTANPTVMKAAQPTSSPNNETVTHLKFQTEEGTSLPFASHESSDQGLSYQQAEAFRTLPIKESIEKYPSLSSAYTVLKLYNENLKAKKVDDVQKKQALLEMSHDLYSAILDGKLPKVSESEETLTGTFTSVKKQANDDTYLLKYKPAKKRALEISISAADFESFQKLNVSKGEPFQIKRQVATAKFIDANGQPVEISQLQPFHFVKENINHETIGVVAEMSLEKLGKSKDTAKNLGVLLTGVARKLEDNQGLSIGSLKALKPQQSVPSPDKKRLSKVIVHQR